MFSVPITFVWYACFKFDETKIVGTMAAACIRWVKPRPDVMKFRTKGRSLMSPGKRVTRWLRGLAFKALQICWPKTPLPPVTKKDCASLLDMAPLHFSAQLPVHFVK